MLKIILIRELQAHIKNRQVLITFLISLLLFLLSAFVMKEEYRQQVEDYYQRSSLNQKWMTKDITRIDRPVPSLTSLVTGLTGRMGNSAKLVRIKSPEITESVGDNVVSELFPAVDLLFIAGIVMSLLALFNAYNTICGEKENRTLALILSNRVARHTILLGKWLAGYFSLTIPFLISFLIGIVVLIMSGSVRFNISDGLSIVLMGFIVSVTIGVFHLLGIFISSRVHSSRMAAFWGLLIWFFLVLIWPNVAVELANNINSVRHDC